MRGIVMALLLFLTPLLAADIAGAWSRTGISKNKKQDFYFVFLPDGLQLNGSGGSNLYDQNLIQNGKIDGNKVSFDIYPDARDTVLHFELVADGETMKGTLNMKNDRETVSSTIELKKDKT
jgi:hypothetical protein